MVPAVEQERRYAKDHGRDRRGMRRVPRRRLGMALGRRLAGQGAFWGDSVGPNPTDRGKNGVKRSLIVDEQGGPLGVVVAGANVHDCKLLKQTIEAVVVERPKSESSSKQRLCLDRGYDNPTGREAAEAT